MTYPEIKKTLSRLKLSAIRKAAGFTVPPSASLLAERIDDKYVNGNSYQYENEKTILSAYLRELSKDVLRLAEHIENTKNNA